MAWIKKNLMLVMGGLVGLILLGGSGFFLFSESSRESAVTGQLDEKRREWDRLNGLNPFPDDNNIKAVKEEAARVQKLATSLKDVLKPVEVPPAADTYALKLLIETTISDLKKEAEAAGVNLPDRYAFTFQKLRELPQIETNKLPKLATQVAQISTLARVLFDAKVHSLDVLRRPSVLKEESGSEFLTKGAITNKFGMIRAPYELSFRAFSSELASVLRKIAALDHCISIKTINIDPTSLPHHGGAASSMQSSMMPPGPTGMGPGGPMNRYGGMDPALAQRYGLAPGGPGGGRPGEGGPQGPGGMDPALAQRYGLGPGGRGSGEAQMRSRYGMPGPGGMAPSSAQAMASPVGPAAPAAPTGPALVLDEKPLRIILQLDFVTPAPVTEGRKSAPAAPAHAAEPAADAAATGNAEPAN